MLGTRYSRVMQKNYAEIMLNDPLELGNMHLGELD